MRLPYIISAELDLPYAELQQTINLNQLEAFRESIDTELRAMGKDTLWVGSSVLRSSMESAIKTTRLPVLSLDARYVRTATQYLGVSREVDAQLNDVGYAPRASYGPLSAQLKRASKLGKELIVADDVLFSGEMINWLADELGLRGTKIGAVICGIAMQEGIDKLALRGIPVEAAFVFEDVEDELCERDFAFVPGSGRRIGMPQSNALYFDRTYGRPMAWASIPAESTGDFCWNSLVRNSILLKADAPSGNFLGYSPAVKAVSQIAIRMEEMV